MVLVLVGASHHDVTLDELARLSSAEQTLLPRLVASPVISGAAVLATCNRFEVYLDALRFHDGVDTAIAAIATEAGLERDFVVDAMRVTVDTSAVQHLFAVASGLESMVVGEDEISGQVRQALMTAQQGGTASPVLQRLFQRALATSKSVSHVTGLGAAGRSVVTVGLDVLDQRHGSLRGRRALVLGTGSYARIVVAALRRAGCEQIEVYSSSGRAGAFAGSHGVTAVATDGLAVALRRADVLIGCSGAPHPLVDGPLLDTSRDGLPVLPVLDLALSPDLDPKAHRRGDVDVIDLAVIHEFAPREHSSAVLQAQDLVLDAVGEFERLETGRSADRVVVAMRSHVMKIIEQEMQTIRRRVDADTADHVSAALHRVARTILHVPTVRAQELARSGDVDAYRHAVHTLFGIDVHHVGDD
jgi:glutamyl-tRNA reductase